jgi:hypothetical protein
LKLRLTCTSPAVPDQQLGAAAADVAQDQRFVS